jgi:hypothetical protein
MIQYVQSPLLLLTPSLTGRSQPSHLPPCFLTSDLLCRRSPSLSLDVGSPLPLPSVGTYAQRCAWWILSTSTLDLLPAPEAFGTVQSVAGAQAEGHPVRVTSRSHCLSPVPWCVTVGMQEKAQGKRMDGHSASIMLSPLQKDPVGP